MAISDPILDRTRLRSGRVVGKRPRRSARLPGREARSRVTRISESFTQPSRTAAGHAQRRPRCSIGLGRQGPGRPRASRPRQGSAYRPLEAALARVLPRVCTCRRLRGGDRTPSRRRSRSRTNGRGWDTTKGDTSWVTWSGGEGLTTTARSSSSASQNRAATSAAIDTPREASSERCAPRPCRTSDTRSGDDWRATGARRSVRGAWMSSQSIVPRSLAF